MHKWLVVLVVACGSGDKPKKRGFTFTQVKPDIYHAAATDDLVAGCNAAIIINRDDVLIVDSHVTPHAARALLDELKQITNKPVRYVVNTHFHFDHVGGNSVYPPTVEIISHELTHHALADGSALKGRAYDRYITSLPGSIADMEKKLAAETDPAKQQQLEKELALDRTFLQQTKEMRATPPTLTFHDRMTLYRGGRKIELRLPGRAHTEGDLVVYLPAEKVLVTGDILVDGIPYMGDGYLEEWITVLENLQSLDFDTILPGHGKPLQGKQPLKNLHAYMTDLLAKIKDAKAKGLSAEDAAKQIDMRAHAASYPRITEVGVDDHAVSRVYEILDQNARD